MANTVRFEGNQVLFCPKQVFFAGIGGQCPPCPGHHDGIPTPCTLPTSGLPTSVNLAISDVENCVTCTTAPTTEAVWDGCLLFNTPDAWSTPNYTDPVYLQTPGGHLIQANISFDAVDCLFRLIVSCRHGTGSVLVWSGEKDVGDGPCGIYYRTDGCDTKTSMVVN